MPERGDTDAGGHALGQRLRRARGKRPLTEVAAAAAISTAYLQKLEAGAVQQPSPNILNQLAEALNTDTIVAAIGPVCADALQALGVTPDVIPARTTMGRCMSSGWAMRRSMTSSAWL